MNCYRIHERLHSDIQSIKNKLESDGLEFQMQGHVHTIPCVLNLKEDSESYLYHAKSALRDFTPIFNILFETSFKREARYDKVLEWSKNHFGDDSPLCNLLSEDLQTWIHHIVRMRNAVEHPGGKSGTLFISDFRSVEQDGRILISEPSWHRNDDPPASVDLGMAAFNSNMLTFFEESFLICLESFPKPSFIILNEIPEDKRLPECPVRFKMTLKKQ